MGPETWAALGVSAAKFVGGLFQAGKGRKILKNTKLPGYEIPGEFEANIGLAKDLKNMGGMPKNQYTQALQNLYRNSNFGMQQLQGRRGAVAGVGNITQRMNDGVTNLAVADANMALQNKRIGTGLQMRANTLLGEQRLQKQNWEKFNPFNLKIQEGQALLGAGMQNAFGGLSDASQIFMMEKYLKK